jgi:hypothetical protein
MDAKELRIGNCVKEIKHNFNGVVRASDYHFEAIEDNEIDLFPIPLTEEWLLKFGFEKFITKDIYPTFALNDFNWNDGILYIVGYSFINHIKYVHQLQNLYFALTNEELTIAI